MLQLMCHMRTTDVAAIYPDYPVICYGQKHVDEWATRGKKEYLRTDSSGYRDAV